MSTDGQCTTDRRHSGLQVWLVLYTVYAFNVYHNMVGARPLRRLAPKIENHVYEAADWIRWLSLEMIAYRTSEHMGGSFSMPKIVAFL